MSRIWALIVAWLIMIVGIWHPYLVNISPESAALVGTFAGLIAAAVAVIG